MSGRLPFDPSRLPSRARAEPEKAAGDDAMSVSQLAKRIGAAIASGVGGTVIVRGEVSGVRQRTHWYFTLKDDSAAVSALLFASTARRIGREPEDGTEVLVHGRVDYYEPSGRVTLMVDRFEPIGRGELEAELRRRVDELRTRGWLEPEARRPLPVFPRRIAVVTSRSGAALQDVIDTARRRCPAVELILFDVLTQGARAAPSVAQAINGLSAHASRLGIDAVLLTRGGGSLEDLWAFNEMVVADAVHGSSVPVVAAIGHETDVTIAELVADARAATPTQAAMLLVPDRAALTRQIDVSASRLGGAAQRILRTAKERVRTIESRPAVRSARGLLEPLRERLTELDDRLTRGLRHDLVRRRRLLGEFDLRLERRRPAAEHARRGEHVDQLERRLRRVLERSLAKRGERLVAAESTARRATVSLTREARGRVDAASRELEAVSPIAVLERGYSVTLGPDGAPLSGSNAAKPGDRLVTRLLDGTVASRVEGAEAAPLRRPKRARVEPDPDQMDLFKTSE